MTEVTLVDLSAVREAFREAPDRNKFERLSKFQQPGFSSLLNAKFNAILYDTSLDI